MTSIHSKSKTLWLRITVGVIVMLLVGVVLVLKVMTMGNGAMTLADANVPLLETPAWRTGNPLSPRQLLLRIETEDEETILLKLSNNEAIYRYNPNTQSLSLVPVERWQGATGPIEDCDTQFPPPYLELDIDTRSDRLVAGQDSKRTREVQTAGSTVLSLRASPSGTMAAVLSAEGRKRGSILPFLGGGGVSGQHFHQVFSLPDAVPIGKSVRIPLKSEREGIIICWSPDERYVVYSDMLFYYLSIVPVDIARRKK